jgi:hypothetical protein
MPPPPPLDLPLPSGTAPTRRRNSYSYSVSGADSSGVCNNNSNNNSYFGGGGAINDSVVGSTHQIQNLPSSHHHRTLQPSPLCARSVLHQESTSGVGGGGGGSGILPLPFAKSTSIKNEEQTQQQLSLSSTLRRMSSTSSPHTLSLSTDQHHLIMGRTAVVVEPPLELEDNRKRWLCLFPPPPVPVALCCSSASCGKGRKT